MITITCFISSACAFVYANYKIFVTPSALDEKLKDYVLKETHSLAYSEIKADIQEMKEKIDKMYDKVMGLS